MADARTLLAPLHQTIVATWDDARAHWRDAVAEDFERRFWLEIDQAMREFLTECERFEDVLSRSENAIRNID